jgi:hypothetical protein
LERERVALAEAERLFGSAGAARAIAVAEAVAERVRSSSSSSGWEFASGIIFGLTKTASPASRAGQQKPGPLRAAYPVLTEYSIHSST